MAEELRDFAKARADKFSLVFDQSFSRNFVENERRSKAEDNLAWLKKHCVYGIAYSSHANFVLVSANKKVLNDAKRTLLEQSKLPSKRFVEI